MTDHTAEPAGKSRYPTHLEADVALRDGSTVRVRPVRAEDEDAMLGFLERLDQGSRMFRFFSIATNLQEAARLMTDVDYSQQYGLLAVRGADEDVVAQAIYIRGRPAEAEIAFAISQDLQGLGLGTLLLAHLAEVAQDNGISVFTAEVMPNNHRMIEVFRESDFPV